MEMTREMRNKLIAYNQIYREMDIIYHSYAKRVGLSDTAFWILYCLAENKNYFTQKELCSNWSFAPQTVNSALKDLEKKGIIYLEIMESNKKNKLIKLTSYGEKIVKDKILSLIELECLSLEAMSEENASLMVKTTREYADILKEKIK